MGFGEKLKRAIIKIKGKLIVATILVLIILVWAIAPLTVSIRHGWILTHIEGYAEPVLDPEENTFDWQIALEDMGKYITHPLEALKICFQEYFGSYFYVTKYFLAFYGIFVFIGIARAFPKHEYEDIENGSSDWSENGEQYQVLSKNKGIILAEKNYLPTDKRGNVNVLVVRRIWCW